MVNFFKPLDLLRTQERGWCPPRNGLPYKNITPVAFHNRFVRKKKEDIFDDIVSTDWLSFKAKEPEKAHVIENKIDCRGRGKNHEAIMKSIMKADVPRICPPMDEKFWYTFYLTLDYLKPHLQTSPSKNFTECDFNFQSLPGDPYEFLSCTTKAEAMYTREFLARVREYMWKIPYYKTFAKKELLPIEEITSFLNKIRTIFNSSFDYLAQCAEMFDEQNEKLMNAAQDNNFWSAYGTNKWEGGMHRMFCQFIFDTIDEADISAYDRVAVLFIVYMLRGAMLQLTPEQEMRFHYLAYHMMYSFITTPEGDLLHTKTGNRSGSRNTASDNTILHIFIKMFIMVCLFLKLKGYLPTIDQIHTVFRTKVYSDDYINNIDLAFFQISVQDWLDFQEEIYIQFGMVRKKPTIIYSTFTGIISPIHTFLGSYINYHPIIKMYYPTPKIGKIASSVVYTVDNKSTLELMCRIMALITLLSYDEQNKEIHDYLCDYYMFLYQEHFNEIPIGHKSLLKEFANRCRDTRYFLHHYFGLESSDSVKGLFLFFSQTMEAEVFNELLRV
jgi:hypothetical protein